MIDFVCSPSLLSSLSALLLLLFEDMFPEVGDVELVLAENAYFLRKKTDKGSRRRIL